jgi:histidinol-phosphate phosphatase family protein
MSKVIFIDRDGVINKDLWRYVEHWGEFEFLPGVLDALRILTEKGYSILIISNQAGIGDGVYTKEALDDINLNFERVVAESGGKIADMFYCLHGKKEGCTCRKPEIGLFKAAEKKWDFDKKETYFIGDKMTDIQAGHRYGIKTALVKTGYGLKEKDLLEASEKPDIVANDLLHAVKMIIEMEKKEDRK